MTFGATFKTLMKKKGKWYRAIFLKPIVTLIRTTYRIKNYECKGNVYVQKITIPNWNWFIKN
jgi:hypothetical protein